MNMANFVMILTFFRLISAPIIFLLLVFFELFSAVLFLFLLSALSDFLDGYLARKFNCESEIGKMLDPIADKILLCASIFGIILITKDYYIGLTGMLILLREFWISGIREFSALNNLHSKTSVSFLGKLKTSSQFLAISSFYFSFMINSSLGIFLSSFLLFLSLLFTLKSGLDYTRNIITNLR